MDVSRHATGAGEAEGEEEGFCQGSLQESGGGEEGGGCVRNGKVAVWKFLQRVKAESMSIDEGH